LVFNGIPARNDLVTMKIHCTYWVLMEF